VHRQGLLGMRTERIFTQTRLGTKRDSQH
jgi:hypothetical protein